MFKYNEYFLYGICRRDIFDDKEIGFKASSKPCLVNWRPEKLRTIALWSPNKPNKWIREERVTKKIYFNPSFLFMYNRDIQKVIMHTMHSCLAST